MQKELIIKAWDLINTKKMLDALQAERKKILKRKKGDETKENG